MFTLEPAKLLKIDAGTLSIGARADITLIDLEMEWRAKTSESLSRNTPFDGWKLKGRAVRTIVDGETVFVLPREAEEPFAIQKPNEVEMSRVRWTCQYAVATVRLSHPC